MSRPRPLRDALLAVSLLTIVPTRAQWAPGERSGASGWFPFAGLLVGLAGYAAVYVATALGWRGDAAMVVAGLVVAGWAVLTRMLHWDGLADVADGIWGGHTPERRLEIMSDSHTGAFGTTAIALTAIIEVAAIASFTSIGHARPLLFVPAIARLAATFAAWLGTPARPGGLGRSVMGRPDISMLVPALSVVVIAGYAMFLGYGLAGALFVLGGVGAALVVPHALSGPVGGVTGDVMGASVKLCEVALFVAAAALWGN